MQAKAELLDKYATGMVVIDQDAKGMIVLDQSVTGMAWHRLALRKL